MHIISPIKLIVSDEKRKHLLLLYSDAKNNPVSQVEQFIWCRFPTFERKTLRLTWYDQEGNAKPVATNEDFERFMQGTSGDERLLHVKLCKQNRHQETDTVPDNKDTTPADSLNDANRVEQNQIVPVPNNNQGPEGLLSRLVLVRSSSGLSMHHPSCVLISQIKNRMRKLKYLNARRVPNFAPLTPVPTQETNALGAWNAMDITEPTVQIKDLEKQEDEAMILGDSVGSSDAALPSDDQTSSRSEQNTNSAVETAIILLEKIVGDTNREFISRLKKEIETLKANNTA